MSRRLLCACLGAAVLMGGLQGSVRAAEPGENPPPSGGALVTLPEAKPVVPPVADMMAGPSVSESMSAHPLLNNDIFREPPPLEDVCAVWRSAGVSVYVLRNGRCTYGVCPKFVQKVVEEKLPPAESLYEILPAALPTPTLYQLRPTARRTLAGSLLFGVNPVLALMPTEKALDAPSDHPQQIAGEDVLQDIPHDAAPCGISGSRRDMEEFDPGYGDWFKWLLSHWSIERNVPHPEQNEGYVHPILPITLVAGGTPVDAPADEIDTPLVPTFEALPMPQEGTPVTKKHKKHGKKTECLPMPQEDTAAAPNGITCPWMRQQAADRHACQFADPQINRSVLENFERLEEADHLLEMARNLANSGYIGEALQYCALAQDLCPGSPCAARAADVMCDLYVRLCEPATKPELGIEQQVRGLMKACRLLMNEGLHEQAAELARQAFALDPQRVAADPLIYKMHLLASTPAKPSAGSEEASEPLSCPYCPPRGKPIPGIVPAKKKTTSSPTTRLAPMGAEEASEEAGPSSVGELVEAMMGGPGRAQFGFGINGDGSLRLCGECTYFGTVYRLMFSRGTLAIWKTPDAAAVQP